MWVIFRPLVQIAIFTIVFGKIVRVDTGGIPYFLFATAAIVPWDYLSQAMSASSLSLITEQRILLKVYFSRMVFPITPVISRLIDFGISAIVAVAIMIFFGVYPTWKLLLLPVFVLLMIIVAVSVGFWFSTMAVRFRDVNHAIPLIVRMLMYTAPVIYSISAIPENFRLIYSMNPIVSVIEGFRACLLGLPFVWIHILPGMATAIVFFIVGLLYFRQMESIFVDVI